MRRWMAGCLLFAAAGLGVEPRILRPPLQVDRDDRYIPKPAEQKVSELFAIVNNSWFRHLSPEQAALAGRDRGALNTNAWDEVPDSTWFTNRMGRRLLVFEEIVVGLPGQPPRPPPWTVDRNTQEGYTPKFRVSDAAGRRYWVKFDPDVAERNSAAERISTLILHAAGYNVPNNSVLQFRTADVKLAEDARFTDHLNRQRPMTLADLDDAFARLKPNSEGRYRGLASLFIEGEPVGKFKYDGRRRDDPNDLIPHELRRELRGLRVIAAWINHADTGDKNTHDVFVSRDGELGHVRHYLLDFGSTLGSGAYTNGPYRVGHEYVFDGSAMGKTFVSMGAWRRPWEAEGRIEFPEVGYFNAELFEPQKWKPNYPNLAFVRMDLGDAYWGAKIVTAFPDEMIDAIVASAEYSRLEAARSVAQTLKLRRHAIGRFYFDAVTPLEEISLAGERLRFRDLAVDRGYVEAASRRYRFWMEDAGGKRLSEPVTCEPEGCPVPSSWNGEPPPDHFGRVVLGWAAIQSECRDGEWAAPVHVALGRPAPGGPVEVLGWRHASR